MFKGFEFAFEETENSLVEVMGFEPGEVQTEG